MKTHEITSIGPSMVDMAFDMSVRKKDYTIALNILGAESGGWKSINDTKQLDEVIRLLIGCSLPYNLGDILALQQKKSFELVAGSSNFGTLAAMDRALRNRSAFISAVGSSDGHTPDATANYFTQSLAKLGIAHIGKPYEGRNPLGLVLATKERTDKVLVMFPGVMGELAKFPEHSYQPKLVQVDAYELRKEPIAQFIDGLIIGKKYDVSLGLGNSVILEGDLRNRILGYIDNQSLTFLTGNEHEFLRLFNITKPRLTEEDYCKIAEQIRVPHVLVTLGERGIVALQDGEAYFQPSFPIDPNKIINTSGAGDTAAGVFISGILEGKDIHSVLKETVYFAAQVLKVPGSHLPKGR